MGMPTVWRIASLVLTTLLACSSADHEAAPASAGPTPATNAPPLPRAEAGFVDVPPQPSGAVSIPGRMFYVFHAADDGELEIDLPANADYPAMHAQVRFPRYESGHMVARSAGRELRDDIEAWLEKR